MYFLALKNLKTIFKDLKTTANSPPSLHTQWRKKKKKERKTLPETWPWNSNLGPVRESVGIRFFSEQYQ